MIGRSAQAGAIGGASSAAASAPAPPYASGCPVVGANPANQMPPSANEPLPGQSKPLSTWRQKSNIPTGAAGDALPPHQEPATSSGDPVSHAVSLCAMQCVSVKAWCQQAGQ